MLRLLLLVSIMLAASCGESCDCGGNEEPLTQKFIVRPIEVAISNEFDSDCVESIEGSIQWFREMGIQVFSISADPTAPYFNGEARPGIIAIMPGHLSSTPSQKVHGETRRSLTINEDIQAAEVIMATCDQLAITHELGHALGLEHVNQNGNLMSPELPQAGYSLNEEQARWILN